MYEFTRRRTPTLDARHLLLVAAKRLPIASSTSRDLLGWLTKSSAASDRRRAVEYGTATHFYRFSILSDSTTTGLIAPRRALTTSSAE